MNWLNAAHASVCEKSLKPFVPECDDHKLLSLGLQAFGLRNLKQPIFCLAQCRVTTHNDVVKRQHIDQGERWGEVSRMGLVDCLNEKRATCWTGAGHNSDAFKFELSGGDMKLKKRRHFNNARGGRMTVGSVTLFHQQIPREKFEALPEVQRYCFLLLGHIHNEISWLQRMAYIASRSGSHLGHLEGSGNMMQATFLARLLLGKLFEFQKVLRPEESPIRGFIGDYFRPTDKAAGATQVATILAHYESEEWIALARNKHFLHYPTLGDARPTLNDPNIEWHVEIAHGKKSSNTFYPTSDFMANYSWLRLTNSGLPVKALKHALKVERILAALTLSTLEQSIGHFVDTTLMHLSDHEVVKIRMGQSIHDMRLNYFVKI